MNNLKEQIIDLIERNRISSTEVADALGKSGVIDDIDLLNPGKFEVGEVQYVYGFNESNWPIHEQLHEVKENSIVFVDMFNCDNKAAFGELVAKYLLLYKKVKGIVVNGLMRDNHSLRKESYPIWCKDVTPLGCYNREVELTDEIKNKVETRKKRFDGGVLVCDDSGCTLIKEERIDEDIFKKLEFIEVQEDIWFYCLDSLKWSTYETVCQKKYLDNPEILPKDLSDKLKDIDLEN